jgi:hypothetical protein
MGLYSTSKYLQYPTLPYSTLPYSTLPTLPYSTLPYPTLPYSTLPYPTLPTLPHPTTCCAVLCCAVLSCPVLSCPVFQLGTRLGSSLLFSSPLTLLRISVADLINQSINQSSSHTLSLPSPLSYLHAATLPTFLSHNQILLIFAPIKDQTSHQSLRSIWLLISTLSYTHYLSPSIATPHRPVTSSHRPIPSLQ